MTDLEAHVEQPGRGDLVKQVSEKIKETGVTYIYYQFVSVTGRIVGKGIPSAHWERLAEKVSSWSMGQPRICLLTVMGTILVTALNPLSLLVFRIPKRFVNYPGTNGSAECFVHCFAIARSVRIQVVY